MSLPPTKFTGFAELRKPDDLLLKLQHDLHRMIEDEGDVYATFDFFITAEHMIDWLHPDRSGKVARGAMRKSNPLLQITSHIANGAKHFVVGAAHHKSVSAIEAPRYVEDGRHDSGSIEVPIVIRLSPHEAALFGAPEIDAIVLAYHVLEYWQEQLKE